MFLEKNTKHCLSWVRTSFQRDFNSDVSRKWQSVNLSNVPLLITYIHTYTHTYIHWITYFIETPFLVHDGDCELLWCTWPVKIDSTVVTGYFFDTFLPFGLRSLPALFLNVHGGVPFTYFSERVISLWQSVSCPHPPLWYQSLQADHVYVALFVLCLRFTQHHVTRCTHPWCDQLLCWLPLRSVGNQVPTPLSDGQQASDVRAACSLDQLHVNAKEYFRSGLADSTHRTYGPAQRQFLSFCDNYGLTPLPASEDTLILFVTSLAALIKPQSINVYLVGVRSLHVSNRYDNPLTPGLRLNQTLRGIERNHCAPPKRKLPITLDLLCKIHVFVNFCSAPTTIMSTGRQLPVAISCYYAPESLRYSTRSALTPDAISHSVTSLLISPRTVSATGWCT